MRDGAEQHREHRDLLQANVHEIISMRGPFSVSWCKNTYTLTPYALKSILFEPQNELGSCRVNLIGLDPSTRIVTINVTAYGNTDTETFREEYILFVENSSNTGNDGGTLRK